MGRNHKVMLYASSQQARMPFQNHQISQEGNKRLKKRFQRYIAIGSLLLLLAASLSAQAGPYFLNKEGNMVWDQATGLVWMRCDLGQTWQNDTCTGKTEAFHFEPALKAAHEFNARGGYAGATDWQVPSARNLATLLLCSEGFVRTHDFRDGQPPIPDDCKDGSARPTVDAVFRMQSEKYRTSTPNDGNYAWYIDFHGGGLYNTYRRNGFGSPVRLVRANQLSGSEAALAFPVSAREVVEAERKARETAERQAQARREAAERQARTQREAAERQAHAQREAENRKRQADRAQALKQLQALGARGLYIEAGKAQRNGSVTVVDTSFGAGELYEMIVDKFPDSEFAVKATDQLTAMGRASRAESAARDADFNTRQRAYEACRIEMNSCYSRTNGKGNCYRDCDRLR